MLRKLLIDNKVTRFSDTFIEVYLLSIQGDPSKGMYGDDGNQPDSTGHARYFTQEKAIATTQAVAEVVQFSFPYSKDPELGSSSIEYKTIYREKNDGRRYIMGPKDYKKKIYLDSFKG